MRKNILSIRKRSKGLSDHNLFSGGLFREYSSVMNVKLYGLSVLMALIVICGCKKDNPIDDTPTAFKATPYKIQTPKGFPTNLNIPADNPLTVEGIALGRYLFYDGRLRGYLGSDPDSLMSCGTCHLQSRAFECGVDHPEFVGGFTHGIKTPTFPNGKPTPHVMLPLFNLVYNHNGYFWNGMIHKESPNPIYRTLQDVVRMGVYAAHEMVSDSFRSVSAIKSIAMYPPMFKAAFGDESITFNRISKAIEQFVLSIVSSNSKAHKVFRGEDSFTADEYAGYRLFVTEDGADCFHCHGGEGNPLFTTNDFYNNAKDTAFNDSRDRYAVTGLDRDKGAYKATSLLNIEHTGPYMHDGRYATLDQVINFYSHGLKYSTNASSLMHYLNPPFSYGAELTPVEKAQLKAFLLTLTDQTLLTNPAYSKPAGLP